MAAKSKPKAVQLVDQNNKAESAESIPRSLDFTRVNIVVVSCRRDRRLKVFPLRDIEPGVPVVMHGDPVGECDFVFPCACTAALVVAAPKKKGKNGRPIKSTAKRIDCGAPVDILRSDPIDLKYDAPDAGVTAPAFKKDGTSEFIARFRQYLTAHRAAAAAFIAASSDQKLVASSSSSSSSSSSAKPVAAVTATAAAPEAPLTPAAMAALAALFGPKSTPATTAAAASTATAGAAAAVKK